MNKLIKLLLIILLVVCGVSAQASNVSKISTEMGIIISVFLSSITSFIVAKCQYSIELKKIYSEFGGQLYSKRLDAYLEVYKLISGFIKNIKRKNVSLEELNDFYEEYSVLDSKHALLFNSDTAAFSHILMLEVKELLTSQKNGDDLVKYLRVSFMEVLGGTERSMRYELGVREYRSPSRFDFFTKFSDEGFSKYQKILIKYKEKHGLN